MIRSRTVRRLAAVVAVSVSGVVGLAAPAVAKPAERPAFPRVIGVVKINHGDARQAIIKARYLCHGEGSLWVSVKQVADRTADPRLAEEGSSQISAAWSDSHRNPVVCDGKAHTTKFAVDQEEPYFDETGPQGPKSDVYGPLAKGYGWTQFCLFDDNNTEVPISDMVFKRVR